jgi:DNA/RNA non-specific endonuclease
MKMDEHTHGSLRFWREATASHDIKFAAGRLQAPGSVDPQRDLAAQRAVSKGRGDDAGHLIAHQFGGPEAPYNLSIQNYRQNQGGGTYWDLEQRWASQLKSGVAVDVTVREMSRKGEDRPYHRHVSWLETHKESLVLGELDFVNTMSPKGRRAEGIRKVGSDNPAKVINLTNMQRSGVNGHSSNTPSLQVPVWVATNEYAAQLGSGVVKMDMESVRAGLLYGLEKTEIQAYLTGRHGQSDNARFYAHGLVDSVRGQIKGELASRRDPDRGR